MKHQSERRLSVQLIGLYTHLDAFQPLASWFFFCFPTLLLLLSPLRKKETIFRYFENNGETRARAAAFFLQWPSRTQTTTEVERERERDIRSATTRLAVVVALETGDDPIVHMTNIVTRAGSMKKKKKTAILYKTTSKLEKKKKKTVETQKQSHSRGHREKETRWPDLVILPGSRRSFSDISLAFESQEQQQLIGSHQKKEIPIVFFFFFFFVSLKVKPVASLREGRKKSRVLWHDKHLQERARIRSACHAEVLSLSLLFFILFLFYFYTFLNPVTKERDNASIGIGTGFDSIYFLWAWRKKRSERRSRIDGSLGWNSKTRLLSAKLIWSTAGWLPKRLEEKKKRKTQTKYKFFFKKKKNERTNEGSRDTRESLSWHPCVTEL